MSRYFIENSLLFSRKGWVCYKKRLFYVREHALLASRRASSTSKKGIILECKNVTHWFLVGYILGCRWWYMRVVRVVSLVGCKDYLSSHELSSLTYITPNESWNALCSLYAEGLLWTRNRELKTSVNSVCSVRERTTQRVTCVSSLREGVFYFSQKNTEEQKNRTHSISQRH